MGNPSDVSGGSQIIKKQLSYAEIEQIGKAFVASKMFGDDMDRTSMAITKIMAGQELGLAPFASMRAVHVIEGNATLSANTMAGMVKSSGRYDYDIKKKDLTGCEIDFFEMRGGKRVKIGTESFDIDEAKMAGMFDPECSNAPLEHNIRKITMYKKGGGSWQKDGCNCKANWKNYPKAMLFARCISNGVRTYCPDVFSGMLVYTPDELNAQVRADGTVIDIDEAGNVTNMPEPKKSDNKKEQNAKEGDIQNEEITEEEGGADMDQDQRSADDIPAGEDQVIDPSNEGTEDHPDITDPNEPAEASGPDEEEPEPPLTVDDEMKEAAWGMYESLPLKSAYKLRFLKDVTGVITKNSMKKDDQWRALYDRSAAILGGDVKLPEEYLTDGQKELV